MSKGARQTSQQQTFADALELVAIVCDRWTRDFSDTTVIFSESRGRSITFREALPPGDPFNPLLALRPAPLKIAQLRFDPTHLTWTLFWANRSERWLPYDGVGLPASNVGYVLDIMTQDVDGCFWG